ncbi:response regulator transcription factor [Anaerococcus hydrogenalis]|uniref:DNA-binding response regulator n=1 Tax=Anaerococcus hydrogenalis TaxID=33029 RepID=A0A2N6UKI5_9FIRM|nr:response regulator transcription factor [Anaerococcus hydrogenalis]MDK7694243.1 response regulator transcription factor [Anaerococcus hydrogenalis]MDK7696021.1 response regulator transcription factor [Anaerococcus hydrogenalis]MDK7707270.1 response regulator transcription factor [Anaerococcus hydrogenalis]PMC82296.1 DNA-binding response regulator [Anaerococcus hydrogenalis]
MDNKRDFNILIVDDEKILLENLYDFLKNKGFKKVYTAKNLKESRFKLENLKIDLLVLDLMLADGSGFDLLKELRKSSDIPVIILSALDGIDDRKEGFKNKADDYLVKPFFPDELLWRIDAVLRRSKKIKGNQKINLGGVIFDKDKGILIKNGKEISLTATQFKILSYLCENINMIVSIDRILEHIWENSYGYENTLITHIYRLREKLEDNPRDPKILITIKGLGYKLVDKG